MKKNKILEIKYNTLKGSLENNQIKGYVIL